jgi:hypothetical protein
MTGITYGGATASSGGKYNGSLGGTYGVDFPTISLGWFIDDVAVDRLQQAHPNLAEGAEASFTARLTNRNELDPLARYETLRERLRYSPTVVNKTLIDGTPKFQVQSQQVGPEKLVAKFDPGSDVDAGQGFWGLLTGYDDSTTRATEWAVLEFSVRVLAWADEYDTKQEVINDLEI